MKKGRLGRLLLAIATVAFASALIVPATAWANGDDDTVTYDIPEDAYRVTNGAELQEAVNSGETTLFLADGEYTDFNVYGKNLVLYGESKNAVLYTKYNGGEGADYDFDSCTVEFYGLTLSSDRFISNGGNNYPGYARMKGTYYDCVIDGKYVLYDESVFNYCTLNITGDEYNIWTWGAPEATFNNCTFNSDGKALLLYGTADTILTVNNCVFNDKGGLPDLKAAIEIGAGYDKNRTLIVSNTTVNGYEVNDQGISTGTTLWANKNSMGIDKLNVIVDGEAVYSDYVAMIGSTGYTSLKTALENAAQATGEVTVEILATITEELNEVMIPAGVTVKGNGNTVITTGTTQGGHDCMFYSEGDCTVQDLTVEAESVWNDQSTQAFDFRNGGTLKNVTVEKRFFAGVLVGGQNVSAEGCVFNTEWGVYSDSTDSSVVGKATIKGCTFNGERAAMLYCPADFTGNTVNSPKGVSAANEEISISGNTFKGGRAVSFSKSCNFKENSLLENTVIEGNGNAIDASYNFWGGGKPTELQADGASFSNYYADAERTILVWVEEDAFKAYNGVNPVTEGTFGFNPSKYLAPGYYASKNADGTWTVRPIPYIPPADPLPETGCTEADACNVFPDFDEDAWYHEYMDWAYENGIITGYDTGFLGPEDHSTRAQVVTVLYRLAGSPAATGEGAWYADAFAWALEAGIVKGYNDDPTKLGENDVVTRQQIATIMYRFAVYMGWDVSVGEDTNILSYPDAADVDEYAVAAMQWAVGAGIIGGYGDTGELAPQAGTERCELAAMLFRLNEAYSVL